VWHSGKLRARQTAEAFWRTCSPLASFAATRDLQPDDPPEWMRDRLVAETDDVLLAGHYPHLPRLLALLVMDTAASFPLHGMVALNRDGNGWREEWRLTCSGPGSTADFSTTASSS
jgi:phosphohistidine phosphatase